MTLSENWLDEFLEEMKKRISIIDDYIEECKSYYSVNPEIMFDATFYYPSLPGKRLRPIVTLLASGAVSMDENMALDAAVGIEFYHTWTLLHDDIIDRDTKRRGYPTAHVKFLDKLSEFIEDVPPNSTFEEELKHWGISLAILAGDILHGLAVDCFTRLLNRGVNPEIIVKLISELENRVITTLVEGETLDVLYSKAKFENLSEEKILNMLWKKTGILYEFSAKCGAMCGLNTIDENNKLVKSLTKYGNFCGMAFQLRDDILGIVGNEQKLGKPVGSDLREGKRTLIVYHAYQNSTETQRKKLMNVLGNPNITASDVEKTVTMLKEIGSIDYVQEKAEKYIDMAIKELSKLPDNKYKKLLIYFGKYLVRRDY